MLRAKYPSYPYENKWVKQWHQQLLDLFLENVAYLARTTPRKFLLVNIWWSWHFRCSSQEGDNIPHSMDTTKIAQLGLPPFKTLEQMFDDCIRSLQEKGFLWIP
jgi:hypothetical protein